MRKAGAVTFLASNLVVSTIERKCFTEGAHEIARTCPVSSEVVAMMAFGEECYLEQTMTQLLSGPAAVDSRPTVVICAWE